MAKNTDTSTKLLVLYDIPSKMTDDRRGTRAFNERNQC